MISQLNATDTIVHYKMEVLHGSYINIRWRVAIGAKTKHDNDTCKRNQGREQFHYKLDGFTGLFVQLKASFVSIIR